MKMNWFILALGSTFALAFMNLLIKKLTNDGVKSEILSLYMIFFALIPITLFAVYKKIPLNIGWNTTLLLILVGISFSIGNLLLIKSINIAPNPGYALAVMSAQVLIVTVCSIFLFKSDFSWIKAIGTLLAIVGVILLGL